MSRTKNYLSGLVTGYTVTFVTIAVGLWLTPFTLRFLNREEYAIFTLAGDMLMWLGLLDIGISSGLSVQAAQLAGKPDAERLNRLASTAFFTQNIISATIFVVGCGLAFLFPNFFGISPALNQQAILVTVLMVTGIAINLFVQTFSSLLIANQQMYVDNLIKLSLIVIRTILTVVFLLFGWKMLSLAVANLAAVIITAILAVIRVWHLLPNLQINKKWFSWDVLKSTSRIGIWFSVGGLAGILITNLDRIVTAKLISIDLVTTLSLTGRLYVLANSLLQQVTNTARPIMGQMFGSGNKTGALVIYRQILLLSTGLVIVASLSIWAGNGLFISWWVGSQNYGGYILDFALCMNLIMNTWVLPNRATLAAGIAYVPQHAISRFVEGLVNITLSIWWAPYFGVLGILISTSVACVLTSAWYLPFLTAKMFQIKYKDIMLSGLFRLSFLLISMIFISVIVRHTAELWEGVLPALFAMAMTFFVGTILLWFLVLDTNLRIRLTQYPSLLVQKIKKATSSLDTES